MEGIEHGGRTTSVRVVEGTGDGPTTLYVHGSGGSHQVWAQQYAPDGPVHPACALDLSGHGDSEDFAGEREAEDSNGRRMVEGSDGDREAEDSDNERASVDILDAYARDVVAVADAVGADVLVGNSMGGAIVLLVALGEVTEATYGPDAIVLAGTGARLPVDEKLRRLLARDFDAAIDLLHGEDVLFHSVDDRTVERSKAAMREAGQRVVRRDFDACHRFDVRDRLGEIDVPALALVGEHDRLTPPEYHRELAESMSDCRYRELSDAAHLAMIDRPDAFNAALAEFLADVR